jgi:hypothetical protein
VKSKAYFNSTHSEVYGDRKEKPEGRNNEETINEYVTRLCETWEENTKWCPLPLLQKALKLTKGCQYRWVMNRFDVVQKNTRRAKIMRSRAVPSRTSYLTVFQQGQKMRMTAGTMNRWSPSVNTTNTIVTRMSICDGSS